MKSSTLLVLSFKKLSGHESNCAYFLLNGLDIEFVGMPKIWFLYIDMRMLIDEFYDDRAEFISFQRSFGDLIEIVVLFYEFEFFKMVLKLELIQVIQKFNSVHNFIKRFYLYETLVSVYQHCAVVKNSLLHLLNILIYYLIEHLVL